MPTAKDKELICYCDTKTTRGYSLYYDTPDGCDIGTKMLVAGRYGLIAGLIFSTYDVLMYSQAVGLGNILGRYMKHTLPLAGMGATFALVSNVALQAREKDDRLNYFLGGFACGPILASWVGSKHAILLGGLFLGAIGYIKKTGIEKRWTFIPDVTSHMGMINSWRKDWSVAADPKFSNPKPGKCDMRDPNDYHHRYQHDPRPLRKMDFEKS